MANVPDSAVEFLLGNLKELIQYQSDLISGVKDNVEVLGKDLELLKAFIKDCTQKQTNSAVLENVVGEIKSVVYDAEDAIETYIVRVSLQKRRSSISRALHAVDDASELRRGRKQIEKVTKYVRDIYKNMVPLGIESMQIVEASSTGPKREKIVMVEEENVIGLEDESQKMIDLLTRGPRRLQVISIVGMFGLGKTTLARKIFNDSKVAYNFHLRAFVNVSQEYNRREVLLRILNSFGHVTEERKKMPDEDLAQLINMQLKKMRYLIVLDDVWTTEAWDDLKRAFPDDGNGSRVVITSQNKSVALHANAEIGPYYMRFLHPEESRMLLRHKVFGQSELPEELEEHEVRILQRCGGLPLAIVVLAGILLNHRHNLRWWERVSEGMTEYIARDMSQMFDVIKLSYNNLPHHLKPCFLYMGVFREDYDIPVWRLLRLWIAEGFIGSHQSISLEDLAEYYLMDLVDKNLVMVGRRSSDGRIKTCRIHDTLRDFCKMEARKENLFHEMKEFSQSVSSSSDAFRRICVNDSVLDYIGSRPFGPHVRSFLCFAKEEIPMPVEYVSSIPRAFKLLRVLEIRSIILTRFPSGLFQLILLKYIAICCHFKVLPEKMLDLWNLQTVIIETSSLILDIKADIWKMTHLRHLHTNASACVQKSKDEAMSSSNLRTLSTISPESCTKEVFDRTPKLKKLGIRGKLAGLFNARGESSLFDSLSRLQELENLKLLNSDQTFELQQLPSPTKFPRRLKKLTLLNTSLDWVHMSTLGKLEMLEVIKLKDNAFKGERWKTEDEGFPNLKVLHIGHTDLKVWETSADHFPKLESLFLRHCTVLEALPPEFGEISTLQEIELYCTSSKLVTSAREIQQNFGSDLKLLFYPPE
ncbi:putative late blight resistance protein homolog R1B-16 [Coffea arabica]|uniref:Late blight resistance protein homolog R1B-16 n=1 Tax=Coffea arabica TaxID=13443 RepID=A0A6P6V9A9_COFAR|nr:putative late blight resistance protein homolog R1B-16 [Coffea arabica]XP_027099494.1 putative late blight resistance protein homolog R1B-16 [Coffea arabica]